MRKLTKQFITVSLAAAMISTTAMQAMAEEIGPGAGLAAPQTPDGTQTESGNRQNTGSGQQNAGTENSNQNTGNQQGQTEQVQTEGVNVSYTTAQGTQMMNISLRLANVKGTITYRVYVNHGGFLPWLADGAPAGGTEDSTYVEAVQIDLTGDAAKHYDVYYTGTSSASGQHGWAKNDALLGTIDRGEHLYNLQVKLVPKGGQAPGTENGRFYSQYYEGLRVESYNTTYTNLDGTTYTGWLDHDNSRFYFVDGKAVTGWQYIDGLKFYFSDQGILVQDVDTLIGKQSKYLLKVNKTLNCMTVYAKDGDKGYIIPVKSMLTSVGDDTPLGTFRTPEKYRWRLMVNDSYTQYATRLTAGQGFLFHSITYNTQNSDDIVNSAYNRLGINRSLGCIRLTCENAKWVYDNCAIGTETQVYEDANVPGPFFKPGVKQIPVDQTWDPTDPAYAGR